MRGDFLPINKKDMQERDWYYVDFAIVTGDAYVDHPSFGAALLGRLLENKGFRVGIIAQPDWKSPKDFDTLGRPRYAFLVTAGNLDSMVSNYTASKRRRTEDDYSPGGKTGKRPDRAPIVYTNRLKDIYPDTPVIIGGIEASLRRLAHYDYWDNSVRRSILADSNADLLVYGMAEKQLSEIAERLKKGESINDLRDIRGTVYLTRELSGDKKILSLPSFKQVASDKVKYAEAFKIQYLNQNPSTARVLAQEHEKYYVVQNPPALPLTEAEMDAIYELPFTRTFHPMYKKAGGVSALKEVEFSVTSHRGCYGGCAFCALNFHQGRIIQPRSEASILREIKLMAEQPNFKGIIHDIGGPTANFRKPSCRRKGCSDKLCLHPAPCKNLQVDHSDYMRLLRKARQVPGVKRVFVRSGVRFDYLMADKRNREILQELCSHHVSGLLKVAPEHVSGKVTTVMRKPGKQVFEDFKNMFYAINKKIGKEQYLVPYFITSHPGTTLRDAIELAEYVRDLGYNPEQVQDFTPTPGSLATCMYYTGMDPITGRKVYVPKKEQERRMQRALLQFRNPRNHEVVREALKVAGREDLIGYGPKALVPPERRGRAAEKPQDKLKHPGRSSLGKKQPAVGKTKGSGSQKKRPKAKKR